MQRERDRESLIPKDYKPRRRASPCIYTSFNYAFVNTCNQYLPSEWTPHCIYTALYVAQYIPIYIINSKAFVERDAFSEREECLNQILLNKINLYILLKKKKKKDDLLGYEKTVASARS